jgi:glyoxylase-like metal-dependent hydrolase (beta-lactamase superfamily II)
MVRRKRARGAVAAFLALGLWAGGAGALAQARPPRTETAALGGGLFKVRVEWVNILVLTGPDGTLLVDTGFPEVREILAAELEKIGALDVRTIVNSHWHFDHTGGNATLGKGALILAHRSVLPLVSGEQTLLGESHAALPPQARPRLTFTGEVDLFVNGERVRIVPLTGGHTDGDCVVLFEKSNILFVGDLVFQGQFPFVDVDHGGSALRLAEVLEKVLRLAPPGVHIIPGHGKEMSAGEVKSYRTMLLETIEVVRRERLLGRTAAELQEADVLKDWAAWDGSFTRRDWIEMVCRSLPGEPEP